MADSTTWSQPDKAAFRSITTKLEPERARKKQQDMQKTVA